MTMIPISGMELMIEIVDHDDIQFPGDTSYRDAGNDDMSVNEWVNDISGMNDRECLAQWHMQKEYIFEGRETPIPIFNTEKVEKKEVAASVVRKKKYGNLERPVLERSNKFTKLGHQIGKVISLQYLVDSGKEVSEAAEQVPYEVSDFDIEQIERFADSGKAGLAWSAGGPGLGNKFPISSQTPYSGMIYLMYCLNPADQEIPLYIGMSRKLGRDNQRLGTNFANITRDSVFGRWGYGSSQHLGELSRAFFSESYDRDPKPKYEDWIDSIFVDQTRVLKKDVYIEMVPFFDEDIESAEEKLIRIASRLFGSQLLNKEYTNNPMR